MKVYGVLFFDAESRPSRSQEMDCENDDDALERVARLRHQHGIEVWDGNRLVWRFDPLGQTKRSAR